VAHVGEELGLRPVRRLRLDAARLGVLDGASELIVRALELAGEGVRFVVADGELVVGSLDAARHHVERGTQLAQLVGASRETVNKALADFASRGWLRLEPRSVVIMDIERLARRAR